MAIRSGLTKISSRLVKSEVQSRLMGHRYPCSLVMSMEKIYSVGSVIKSVHRMISGSGQIQRSVETNAEAWI